MGKEKMLYGMDLGSRAVKLVGFEDGRAVRMEMYDTARFYREFGRTDGGGMDVSRGLPGVENASSGGLVVTGYGRYAVRVRGARVISEIKAHTIGAVRQSGLSGFTLLDIGGQDTKVVAVKDGRMADFAMNDRCAASSGRYMENMARVLDMELDELARHMDEPAKLSATCAIFGESEVVQKMAEGVPVEALAAGVNLSIVRRVMPLLARFPDGPVVFSGGVAKNRAVAGLLGLHTGREVLTLDEPVFNGAMGCALSAGAR